MTELSKDRRLKIYRTILSLGNIWGNIHNGVWEGGIDPVSFLDRIWPLRLMSSSDPRFRNAAEDARQHLINNDDWDDDYTFLDRFRLLECSEDEFLKFVNTAVSIDVRTDEREVSKYVDAIEKELPKGYSFHQITAADGKKVFVLLAKEARDEYEYPINIPHNIVKFYVDSEPDSYPAFCLSSDNWDDFGYKTNFSLYYKISGITCKSLGNIKIFKESEPTTKKCIPNVFTTLPDSFCSLMQSKNGYAKLKQIRPDDYKSILFAIRDAAYYPQIRERFETMGCFKSSLLRDYETSSLLSNVKRELELGKNEDNWNFSFKSELPYSKSPITLGFAFGNLCDEDNIHRIKALIGPNGAGKTSILRSLVEKLIRGEVEFLPTTPIFNKVIAISFSIFDSFINLRGKSVLNYTYCGLHNNENVIMTEGDREARLKIALDLISKSYTVSSGRILSRFCSALQIFFTREWVDEVYNDEGLQVNKIVEQSRTMSSGESMILNLVASLYANIRKNSLIVFDELEVHLHPRAIRQMMSLLFKITREFESACILATHSSIVVQELLADNVTIIEKVNVESEEGMPIQEAQTRCLNRESLAENLSAVSNEIFGENTLQPHYISFIRNCAGSASSFDELLNDVTSAGLPPSLPLYLAARDIFENIQTK
ncbi:MAG: AAA family ATPase [Muribaculaceae bacterium]|nr:AAA family ATPase [Muribaculaceae bacterium]